jgi:hypothetical protein
MSLLSAARFLVLHRVVNAVEADADAFLVRRLPMSLQTSLSHGAFLKWWCDAVTDAAVLLMPLIQPRRLRGISHTTSSNLDVFRPARAQQPAPVLMFVHGGIWTLGHRRHYRALGQRLAAEGFVAVIVGYTTWPRADIRAQVREVRSAIAHATSACADWGGDPERVFAGGQSSGAHACALALLQLPGEERHGARCAGLVGMAGPYDLVAHLSFEARRGVDKACCSAMRCTAHHQRRHHRRFSYSHRRR